MANESDKGDHRDNSDSDWLEQARAAFCRRWLLENGRDLRDPSTRLEMARWLYRKGD